MRLRVPALGGGRRRGRPVRPRRRAPRRRRRPSTRRPRPTSGGVRRCRSGTRPSPYRWVVGGGDVGYAWVNGAGVFRHDVPDDLDFMLSRRARRARLARARASSTRSSRTGSRRRRRSAATATGPSGRSRADWDELPDRPRAGDAVRALRRRPPRDRAAPRPRRAARRQRRLPDAGLPGRRAPTATTRARSDGSIRCSAATRRSSRSSRAVARARPPRRRRPHAQPLRRRRTSGSAPRSRRPTRPSASSSTSTSSLPGGYESWLGIRSLPKLAWGSPELRRRHDRGHAPLARAAVRARRLAHRRREHGRPLPRVRAARRASRARSGSSVGDKLLVAEHGHDFRADLQGDGWHGSMNYSGFLRPVWTWLRGDELPEELLSFFWSIPVGLPRLPGDDGRRGDAQLPRRAPLGSRPPLVDAARQPRHGALPHRRRLARGAARRRRPADDDARGADGVRRRRARARGRLGRGRAADDALEPARTRGTRRRSRATAR